MCSSRRSGRRPSSPSDCVTWQATTFGQVPERWAYVIQDYEPGFYPMSAQSELARATY